MKTLRIFEPRQHYLTTVFRDGKRNARRIRVKSVDQLERLVEQQPNNTDLYITKYAKDDIVWNIILDFDSEEDKDVAYKDVMTLRKFLAKKGINVVVVDSTNKGYHGYLEIPPTSFRLFNYNEIEEPSLFFKHYVKELCKIDSFKFKSLDEVNFNASLDGNIRVIGSIHPKSRQVVYIKQGEFHDIVQDLDYYENAMHYHTAMYKVAYDKYCKELEDIETKRLQYQSRLKTEDDLLDIDLRDVFRNIFNLQKVREYGGVIWCCCPFHNDGNPSFCIQKTHYFCSACGEKGNIFSLIKKGLVEAPKQEYWLTEGAKRCLKEH